MHNGAILIPESCDDTVERVKTGKYSHICEKLTALKVISDDFSSNGICNLYLTPQPLLSQPYAMIFQVIITETVLQLFLQYICILERKSLHY